MLRSEQNIPLLDLVSEQSVCGEVVFGLGELLFNKLVIIGRIN